MSYKRINVQEARELIENSNAQVIDVRDPASYQAGHIPDAEAVHAASHRVLLPRKHEPGSGRLLQQKRI